MALTTAEAVDEVGEAPQSEPRFVGVSNNLALLLPSAATAVPAEVREANDKALYAYDIYWRARSEYFSAKSEAVKSPALDRASDRSAVAAGNPLSANRLAPAAKAAEVAALRCQQATLDAYLDAQRHLAGVIHRAKPSWAPKQRKVIGTTQAEVRSLLTQLALTFDRLTIERRVLDGLELMPDGGSLHRVSFGRSQRRDEDAITSKREKAAAAVRLHAQQGGNFSTMVPRDFDSLIAALSMLVDNDR